MTIIQQKKNISSITDTTYMAVNVGKGFKLSGSFYTDIRWGKVKIQCHHFEFKV